VTVIVARVEEVPGPLRIRARRLEHRPDPAAARAAPRPYDLAMRIGVYPGSFNPPTIAHLAIAEAAVDQCRLDRIELVISRDALGKHPDDLLPVDERSSRLGRLAVERPWLAIAVTERRLIVDIAADYDLVVVGADKWAQVVDPAWYGDSTDERDAVLARLPHVAVAPRPPAALPEPGPRLTVLDIDDALHEVSSTAVRDGRAEWHGR
jgi:hypothetical protein